LRCSFDALAGAPFKLRSKEVGRRRAKGWSRGDRVGDWRLSDKEEKAK
jgi:hypothetical protein